MELKEILSCAVNGEIRAIGAGSGRAAWLLSDGAVMSLDCGTGQLCGFLTPRKP